MMSGPEPTLAATAAFGRMSSQLSLSTRTWTPVASVKCLVLASHCVLVALHERRPAQHAQARAGLGRECQRVLGEGGRADEPAAAPRPRQRPAVVRITSRLVNFIVISSLGFLVRLRSPSGSAFEPLSGFSVEQMDQAGLGGEPHGLARLEGMALAENRDDVLAARRAADDLDFRAGRLDDDDLDREALRRRAADAPAGCRAPPAVPLAAPARRSSGREMPPAPSKDGAPSPPISPRRKFIAGEPMKPATKRLSGRS